MRATGSLTTRAPGGMMMEGLPPKVRALAESGVDGAGAGAEGDLRGADGEGVEAEFVGEDDADGGAADGDVDDLAEGGAVGSGAPNLPSGFLAAIGEVAQVPTQWSAVRRGAVR